MSIEAIQRQYNEVVAPHYDLDPQGVIGRSLERAISQLNQLRLLEDSPRRLRVLDVGMGTGRFLEMLKALGNGHVRPYGLDLAEKMVDVARRRLPDLVAEVDDAANLDACFLGQSFDLICTHFITGFVPMSVLAPKIWSRLEDGSYWSLVGGTKAGFPALQAKTDNRIIRRLSGAGARKLEDVLLNPADQEEVERNLESHGFEVCRAETFEPEVDFPNFDEFMEFAHRGGWFTPLIEALELHEVGKVKRWLFNTFLFPVKDHHSIAIVLARKVGNKNGS